MLRQYSKRFGEVRVKAGDDNPVVELHLESNEYVVDFKWTSVRWSYSRKTAWHRWQATIETRLP